MHLDSADIGALFWLAACLCALAVGGRPERLVAATLLVDLGVIFLSPAVTPGDAIQWVALAGDAVVLAVMVLIVVRHRRTWLLVTIGFQLVSILVHIPRMIDPDIHRWAYAAANNFAGYAVVLALLTATFTSFVGRRSDASQRGR